MDLSPVVPSVGEERGSPVPEVEEELHAADVEALERRIVEIALDRTRSKFGAMFLWDEQAGGLRMDFHVVNGLVVEMPNILIRPRKSGRRNGIALWVQEHHRPYLCRDSSRDPCYSPYFVDLNSVAAVPIPYQERAIGVLSVGATDVDAFSEIDLRTLERVATASAKFLRRAQLHRWKIRTEGRPFFIKGLCPEWMEVEQQIERVAATDAPVLIQGESGTGKELVAHALHFNSRRSSRPFLPVNCAAIPESLLESALFGHMRGAFTGAGSDKIGEFQKADGATLFLDEVGELAPPLQAKLLRAVEQGEIQPIGADGPPRRVDVRLICATNRDLREAVLQNRFRADLFHRLSLVTMHLPPLRRMKGQLDVIAEVFLQQAARRHRKEVRRISTGASALLREYDFPGNVRELKNAIEHAVIMATGDTILSQHLPKALRTAPAGRMDPPFKSLRQLREEWLAPPERQFLSVLLQESGGDVRAAAARLGISGVSLYRLLKKRGVRFRRSVWIVPGAGS